MPKQTRTGGKNIYHKKGFIDKGMLWNGVVYPLFTDKQRSTKSWSIANSINSKNINKADLDRLKSLITNAKTKQEAEEAYISFNKARGIPEEVAIKALELSNNRQARLFIGNVSSNEILDFNKVARDKISLRVLGGIRDGIPIFEEVSGQGIPKEKLIKPTKIEEPGDVKSKKDLANQLGITESDFDKRISDYKNELFELKNKGEMLNLNKMDAITKKYFKNLDEKPLFKVINEEIKKQQEAISTIIKDGIDGVVKYMVDGGYKIGANALNALYDDLIGQDLRKAQRIAEIATTIKGKLEAIAPYAVGSLILKGIFPLYDPAVIYSAGLLLAKLDQMIKPQTLEQIENEVLEQKRLNEIEEQKRIELKSKEIEQLRLRRLEDEAMKEAIEETPPEPVGKRETFGKGDPSKTKKLEDEAMKEAIEETPPEPVGERETFGKGDPSKPKPNIRMEINEPIPPKPPSPKAKQGETDVTEQIQKRLMEQEGTAGYSPTTQDETGLDLDSEEDTGIHNEAIQRIATMNDYDFSFTKKSLLQVNQLPNDKNELRKMGEKCIREYGFLLGILAPKNNFSKQEVEELYTLKHILKQVIRLEAQYKRALLKMRVASGSNQLDKLMSEGQLGLVLNAGSLNISPQQAVEQSSTSPVLEPEPKQGTDIEQKPQKPQMDIFEEMGMKKKKKNKKGRLNMEYQDRRKAMLREPKNIVFKGRLNPTPQFQNLRSEAERLNENPVPLVFKSNPNMNRMRRFNVGY